MPEVATTTSAETTDVCGQRLRSVQHRDARSVADSQIPTFQPCNQAVIANRNDATTIDRSTDELTPDFDEKRALHPDCKTGTTDTFGRPRGGVLGQIMRLDEGR